MRFRRLVGWSALAACGLSACGGGTYAPASDPGPAHPVNVYVNAETGNDANPGTLLAPFKTITHALLVVTYGHDVHVLPGLYDWTNGETFPLVVPTGVRLLGDEIMLGEGPPSTEIEGTGYAPSWATWQPVLTVAAAAVVLDQGATLGGFVVRNSANLSQSHVDCAVIMARPGATLRRCTVTSAHEHGLWVVNQADACQVWGNRFESNATGIRYQPFGPLGFGGEVLFEENVVTGNTVGVEASEEGADFGGGFQGSAGGNTLAGNGVADLIVWPAAGGFYAQYGFWDEVPPAHAYTSPPPGVDIYTPTGGALPATVYSGGAQIAGP